MTKITYVQAINLALRALNGETINSREEVIEKLFALGLSLEKRNTHKSVKPTKKQSENAEIKQCIANYLAEHASAKCGEIATAVGISGQRCSALLSQMVEQGTVVKTTEKRVSLFSLADEDDPVQALPSELDA